MGPDPIRTTEGIFYIIGDGGKAHHERQEEAKRYTYRIYCGSSYDDGPGYSDPCNGIMKPEFKDGKIIGLKCSNCYNRIQLYDPPDWNIEVLKDGKIIQEAEVRF
jgi:hypothetical protein